MHRFELALGFFFATTVLQDTGSFFDKTATLFRRCTQNAIELTLTNDHVHLATQTRVAQKLLHIKQTNVFAVNRVFRGAVSKQRATDCHLGVIDRQSAIRVINRQSDFGTTQRTLGCGTRKNDVFHLAAAKSLRALLTHNPGKCVNNV